MAFSKELKEILDVFKEKYEKSFSHEEFVSFGECKAELKKQRDTGSKVRKRAAEELVILLGIWESSLELHQMRSLSLVALRAQVLRIYVLIYYLCLLRIQRTKHKDKRREYVDFIAELLRRRSKSLQRLTETMTAENMEKPEDSFLEIDGFMRSHYEKLPLLEPSKGLLKKINERMPDGSILKLQAFIRIIDLAEVLVFEKLREMEETNYKSKEVGIELTSYLILSYMDYEKQDNWAKRYASKGLKIHIGREIFGAWDDKIDKIYRQEWIRESFLDDDGDASLEKNDENYQYINKLLMGKIMDYINENLKNQSKSDHEKSDFEKEADFKIEKLLREKQSKQEGITSKDIAKHLGMSERTVKKFLKVEGEPNILNIWLQIINKYGISENAILGGDPFVTRDGKEILFVRQPSPRYKK